VRPPTVITRRITAVTLQTNRNCCNQAITHIENWVNEHNRSQAQKQVILSAHSVHPEEELRRIRSPSIPVALFHSELTL
jgi:hypothetical protein